MCSVVFIGCTHSHTQLLQQGDLCLHRVAILAPLLFELKYTRKACLQPSESLVIEAITASKHKKLWDLSVRYFLYCPNLATLVPSADAKLIDLRLGHVSPLLSVIQLMLDLPKLGQVGVRLQILRHREKGEVTFAFQTQSLFWFE